MLVGARRDKRRMWAVAEREEREMPDSVERLAERVGLSERRAQGAVARFRRQRRSE